MPPKMRELIDEARRTRKIIRCSYQDLQWTPDELERDIAAGRFRWGVQNFRLDDPANAIAEAERRAADTAREAAALRQKYLAM